MLDRKFEGFVVNCIVKALFATAWASRFPTLSHGFGFVQYSRKTLPFAESQNQFASFNPWSCLSRSS